MPIADKTHTEKQIFSKKEMRMLGHDLTWWNNLMVISVWVAAGAALSVAIAQGVVIKLQRKTEIAAAKAFEEYKIESSRAIAEANAVAELGKAQAAKATLELEKLRTPRTLNAEQKARILEKVKKYSGQTFDVAYATGFPESLNFMETIEGILLEAGWKVVPWEGATIILRRPNKPEAGIVVDKIGVVIHLSSPDKTPPPANITESAKSLAEALKAEKVDVKTEYGPLIGNTNTGAVHMFVGTKP